jgi:hypothetical protein
MQRIRSDAIKPAGKIVVHQNGAGNYRLLENLSNEITGLLSGHQQFLSPIRIH